MAAKIEWNGSTGQLTTAANWVGGVAPGTADTAIFNRGSQSVDPSLGQIDQVTAIEVHPGYTGAIGGSGNEMVMTASAYIKHIGSAAFWWKDNNETTNVKTPEIFIAATSNSTVVHIGAESLAGLASLGNLTVYRGTVTLDGDCDNIDLLEVGFVTNVAQDVTLTANNGSYTITELFQRGGTVTLNETVTNARVANGVLTLPVGNSGAVTNLYQSGGRVEHFTTNTITMARVAHGFLDLGSSPKTVTTLLRGPGAQVIRNSNIHTITNEYDLTDVNEAA